MMTTKSRPKLILIAGVARSGSTALDLILGNRPDSASLGEIYAWYRPFRPHHLEPTCICGRTVRECPVWSRIDRPPANQLHRTVADARDVDIVVDSSKSLNWIRDAHRWASRAGMDAHVILSWRRPKATAYSYWKRGAPGWAENLEGYLRRLRSLDVPWRAVSFDSLVADPVAALTALYEPMSLRYEPGQERFWEGEYHSMFGDAGTVSQVKEGASSLAGPRYSEDFERYWSGLSDELLARMDAVDALALSGDDGGSAKRMLPPSWYLKERAICARDGVLLRLRPGRNIR